MHIYIIVILLNKSTAEKRDNYGQLCLETVRVFYQSDNRCNCTGKETADSFKGANTTCPKMCKFEMSNVNSKGKLGLKIQLLFNSYNATIDACIHPSQIFRNLTINCSSWNEGDYAVWGPLGCSDSNGQCDRISTVCACHCHPGYTSVKNECKKAKVKVNETCESDTQCTGTDFSRNCSGGICVCQVGYVSINNTCHPGNIALGHTCVSDLQCTDTPWATNCTDGRCTCQVGHIPINNTCYPGDLSLNQSCIYDSQCLGSPYTGCLVGKCSCTRGHSAKDSSDCESMNKGKEYRADGNNKSLLGAIFGGLLAGVVIVTVTAFLIYKRFCHNDTTRKEPVIHFEKNDTKRVDDNATPLIENKQENVANKSRPDHSEEAVDYSHIYDETRNALTQDDIYHHLNEEKEQKQDDNNYDHASAAVDHVTNLNEYSAISDFNNDKTVSPTEEKDEYFVLEQSFSKDG